MLYLVTYDLKVPGRDYDKLYDTLKSSTAWWHYLESTWVLQTSDSLSIWRKKIQDILDANDNFMIVDITGKQYDGWLPKEAWSWLNSRNQ